jgi:aconitate hydratase 2/2-methylisocitrate dehydratase
MDLFVNRVPPGVDEAAYVKAAWLASVVSGETKSPLVSPLKAGSYTRPLFGST